MTRSQLFRRITLLLFILLLTVGSTVPDWETVNYSDPDGPLYRGQYAGVVEGATQELTAVSFNIRYARDIDGALALLTSHPALRDADLLFLQEMDAPGTAQIAEALGMDYVYFPASIHRHHERDFGNAVLSRWPLRAAEKVVLPRLSPFSGQLRTATGATALIDGESVTLYSTHTETFLSTPAHRADQQTALAAHLDGDAGYAILGGDFNTVTEAGVAALVERLGGAALEHATADVGPTIFKLGVAAPADHLFSRGFTVLESGAVDPGEVSDHWPVYARLAFAP